MSAKKRTNVRKKRVPQNNNTKQIMVIVVIVMSVVYGACQSLPEGSVQEEEVAQVPTVTSLKTEVPQEDVVEEAPAVTSKKYQAPPPMTIDVDKQYFATIKMVNGGEFVIQLYPDEAPITVNSFVFLAREGFFDGVTFHRVLAGFMAQGGDPTGTGGSGPGYQFVNEDSDLVFDQAGVVAMANAGRDTNGSQFFITFGPQGNLDGGYTIFGQVIEGMEVVMEIRQRDPNVNPDYPGDAMESVTIEEK